jgi:hypothetical protein
MISHPFLVPSGKAELWMGLIRISIAETILQLMQVLTVSSNVSVISYRRELP